ncbi:MAG: hypothetical protein IE934_07370 [Sphingopyxis sp.]|nr:hypothetical protein [Sphingopyxis sp.]
MADESMGAGAISGMIGGVLSLLTLLGGGIAFLMKRGDVSKASREAKLDKWYLELKAEQAEVNRQREDYVEQLITRLEALERKDSARDIQMRALRVAFELVQAALRERDPNHNALGLADEMLKQAFPVHPATPADMVRQLVSIEEQTGGGT